MEVFVPVGFGFFQLRDEFPEQVDGDHDALLVKVFRHPDGIFDLFPGDISFGKDPHEILRHIRQHGRDHLIEHNSAILERDNSTCKVIVLLIISQFREKLLPHLPE
jgi:hypothetical protein